MNINYLLKRSIYLNFLSLHIPAYPLKLLIARVSKMTKFLQTIANKDKGCPVIGMADFRGDC